MKPGPLFALAVTGLLFAWLSARACPALGRLYRAHRRHSLVLFDFANIESYDPAGNFYPTASDACE